jgi:hypothetical protein
MAHFSQAANKEKEQGKEGGGSRGCDVPQHDIRYILEHQECSISERAPAALRAGQENTLRISIGNSVDFHLSTNK